MTTPVGVFPPEEKKLLRSANSIVPTFGLIACRKSSSRRSYNSLRRLSTYPFHRRDERTSLPVFRLTFSLFRNRTFRVHRLRGYIGLTTSHPSIRFSTFLSRLPIPRYGSLERSLPLGCPERLRWCFLYGCMSLPAFISLQIRMLIFCLSQ